MRQLSNFIHKFLFFLYTSNGDRMKLGIPRALYDYFFHDLWEEYFKNLHMEVVYSEETNKEIINLGEKYASSEMCLSLKIFLGHVASLQGKCDGILIPQMDNFGIRNQMCSNFLALYNVVSNLFTIPIYTYKIDYIKHQKEKKGLLEIGRQLGFSKKKCEEAYQKAFLVDKRKRQQNIIKNSTKLRLKKTKVLVVGHSYNLHDAYIGKIIEDILRKEECEIIYSDYFDAEATNQLSKYLSKELYWKYSKENIGSIILCQDKVDGILFLSTFPCGLDSLVIELVMRKISIPYLNLVLDDLDAVAGMETRIESFIDILKQNKS